MIKGKQRTLYFVLIAMLGILLFVFYQTYQENKALKSRLGAEYQTVTIKTINLLKEELSSDYLKISFQSTRGEEFYTYMMHEIDNLTYSLYRNNMPEIAMQMDVLERQLYHLKKEGENFSEEDRKELEFNLSQLISVLSSVHTSLGDDEQQWFKEIHNDSSGTQEYIRRELAKYSNESGFDAYYGPSHSSTRIPEVLLPEVSSTVYRISN